MSTATHGKRSLAMAMKDAIAFRELFAGCFDRWEIAGSCRRQAPEVGDIEHVVIPKFGEVADPDNLFGGTNRMNLVAHRSDELVKAKTVSKHNYNGTVRWGEKLRGMDFNGFNNEIFFADEDNWGPKLAIYTGPADYSKMLVTMIQRTKFRNDQGYVWNINDWTCACGAVREDVEYVKKTDPNRNPPVLTGGWEQKLRDETVMVATCLNCGRHGTVRPAKVSVPTEKQYFEMCGVAWCEPEARR